jgi:hypothetical protein
VIFQILTESFFQFCQDTNSRKIAKKTESRFSIFKLGDFEIVSKNAYNTRGKFSGFENDYRYKISSRLDNSNHAHFVVAFSTILGEKELRLRLPF